MYRILLFLNDESDSVLTFAFAKSETFSRFVYRVGRNFSVLLVLTFCVAADFAIKTKLQKPWIDYGIAII